MPGLVLGMSLAGIPGGPAHAGQDSPRGNVDLPRFPSISPDGSTVVFSWRGDLWKVSRAGGTAVRLTSHPAREHDSAWSPDGSRIVFESDRDGVTNLWSMTPEGTDIRRVTTLDTSVDLTDVNTDADGASWVAFTGSLEAEPYRESRPYEVPLAGGEPRRIHDAFGGGGVRSVDGRRVAFERGGVRTTRRHYRGADRRDIWVFDSTLGTFSKIDEWSGNDFDPRWSDSERVFFLSDRADDTVNVHRISVDTGVAEPISRFKDIDVHSFDATPDGRFIVLHRWDRLYTIDLDDETRTPVPIEIIAAEDSLSDERVVDVSRRVTESALNPDGETMAVVAWGDVYVRGVEEDSETVRVTATPGREFDIAWSPDGCTLYFTAVEDGRSSIRAATVTRTRDEIRDTHATALSAIDRTIDPVESEVDPIETTVEMEDSSDADPGTDSEADEDSDATEEGESDADDESSGEEDANGPARWADAREVAVSTVIASDGQPRRPVPSPDGTRVAYVRDGGDLTILDLESGGSSVIQSGWDGWIEPVWSPDSEWIAFSQNDINFNRDIYVVPSDASDRPVNVSRHPNNDRSPRFSGDGRILSFTSERRDNDYDLYLVMLDRDLEKLGPRELEEYFEERRDAAKKMKPLKLDVESASSEEKDEDGNREDDAAFDRDDLESAYRRLRTVTRLPGDVRDIELLPAGDAIVFEYVTGAPEAEGLYRVDWDGDDQKRLRDTMSLMHLDLSGKTLVGVARDQAVTVDLTKSGRTETVPISGQIRMSRTEHAGEKFKDAASIMGELFYDPDMKGLDWEALTDRYHALASQTHTADEFEWVGNRLLGELSSSHQGMRTPRRSLEATASYGRLGARTVPVEDGYRVVETVPEGPAEESDTPLLVGDVVVGIEGNPFDLGSMPPETIASRLGGRIGKETMVTVRRSDNAGGTVDIDLLLEPISRGREGTLQYRVMQRRRAAMVDDWSNGRLGYAHIRGMNQSSLEEFERDLFAAAEGRDGLVVDVRANGGGWTTDRLLSSIMVKPHAYTLPRGADRTETGGYPQDRLFIQRYVLPMNMLCNEKSYSNAEIISHAFKQLDRGTLVGQQTHGSVISTGQARLVDGTTVRTPGRGWFLPDGTDMDNNGAMPDIVIDQRPEDEVAGADPQLKAAVEDLLRRINAEAGKP